MKDALKTFGKFLFAILLLIGILYIFMKIYDYKSEQKRVKVNYTLSKEEILQIEDGDIILRHGYGFVSDMIGEKLSEEISLSHCAILEKHDSTINVIHSVSQSLSDFDGVQSQDLKRFINDSKKNSVIVVRYKGIGSENRSLISKRARYYLEKRIPFDNNFDIKDSTEFFCTELLWKVFKDSYGIDIYEGKYGKDNNEFLKFDIFFNPKYFEVVFSHHNKKAKDTIE